MRRSQLEFLLLEASKIVDAEEFLVIGSQSVLATWNDDQLPEEATRSREADMLVRVRNGVRLSDDQADVVSQFLETIGVLSAFDAQHGIYVDSVSPGTASLPRGWEERLVALHVEHDSGDVVTGMCLDPYDACVSKLVANREHDREFVGALIRSGLITASDLQSRLEMYAPGGPDINHAFVFVQGFFD